MEATTQHSAVRAPGREHIPIYPKGFIAVRILQLIFGVIVLGLGAFGVWWSAGLADGPIFILVVALFTLITSIYHLVAEFGAPSIYNYWAVLGLDIFMVIMWLSSFALLASQVAAWFAYSYTDYYYGYSYGLSSGDKIVVSCLAAAAALGGVQFVLHIVSLVIHSINLHRHRAAGLHCMPGASASAPPAAPATVATGAPVGAVATPEAEKPVTYQQVAPQPTPSPAPAYIQAYPVQQMQPQQLQPQQMQPQQLQPQQQQQYYVQQGQVAQLPTHPQ